MVSVHPNCSKRQAGIYFHPNNSLQRPAGGMAEDVSKKVRKPYVISKSRESWTEMEHDRFLEALHCISLIGIGKKIEAFCRVQDYYSVTPDFAPVYNFLGSVLDPNTSGHSQRLKNMDQCGDGVVVDEEPCH